MNWVLLPVDDDPADLIRIFPAPPWAAERPGWRRLLEHWRVHARARVRYDDARYMVPSAAWAQSCFSCAMLMLWDEELYDARAGRFTPESVVERGLREFGGYDAVLLWQAYPRIGFDERNQFDFFRELPGGLAALKDLVSRFHASQVKVILPLNPWDRATRPEQKPQVEVLADILTEVGADGMFLDTLSSLPSDQHGKSRILQEEWVLESEGSLPLARIADHLMSWGQGFEDTIAPGIVRNKWFEPRHMVHMIERWTHDHSGELHTAWMNGAGLIVWENVFGTWVGWTERDRALLRAMLPVQRRFARHFTQGEWTPLIATAGPVYATRWKLEGCTLWTLVNREDRWVDGPLVPVDSEDHRVYLDLIRGVEVKPVQTATGPALCGAVGPRGVGAFAAIRESDRQHFVRFLDHQAQAWSTASWDTRFPESSVGGRLVPSAPQRETPAGMARVPGGQLQVTSTFRERECGTYEEHPFALDYDTYQYDPEHHFDLFGSHTRTVTLGELAVDTRPVSNAQYAAFLEQSTYVPRFRENFLKHWNGAAPPADIRGQPVVFVDLEDARAYAAWAGKRLPTDEEWQHAMQSASLDHGTPRVWNWTESERGDGRTRWCLIKGGSDFRAGGSMWYADGGPQDPAFSAKFILSWPGLDRCGTIGFRCVVDLE